MGVQPVTNYKKKQFKADFSSKIAKSLNVLEFTSGN